jgi:xanthine dehydrogenase small subunit
VVETPAMNHLRFNLNGEWVEERGLSPTTTLLRYLRDRRSLTGTKEGCAEGDCGACTVAVAERGVDGKPVWRAVNSCLLLLPMLQGKSVLTVEALKDKGDDGYHPAQVAMAKALGSQCGYCTPGIVMAMFEATYRTDLDAPWKLDDQLCGNLCRCTGYRPIREAAEVVAGSCPKDRFSEALVKAGPASMALDYEATSQRFATPATFEALWNELDAHPDARFVVGGTDLSLEVTKKFAVLPKLISLEAIGELKSLAEFDGGFRLGSGATVSELEDFAKDRLPSLHRMVRYFGARQIKHRGTLGGNLCTASPIGDLAPALLSLGATAVIRGRAGERRVPLDQFFPGYRKTALGPKEVLAAIEVPRVAASARAISYKVSKRRELDISTVSAAFYVDTDASGRVTTARLAYGGMAATPKRAAGAEAALVGQPWNEASIAAAAKAIATDFTPMSDHRGSAPYRSLVAANLLRGFFEETRAVKQPKLTARHAATVQTAEEVARG